jgi:hypothetical protein
VPLEETHEEKLNYLLPGVTASGQIPAWPPDVFCLCAAVLQCSGAYSSLVEDRQTYLGGSSSAERAAKLDTLGSLWRRSAIGDGKIPAEVRRWWMALLTEKALAISQISKSKPCTTALLNLLAVSDEACHGVGIFLPGRNAGITPEEILDDKFADIATEFLLDIETVGVGPLRDFRSPLQLFRPYRIWKAYQLTSEQ